MLLLHDMHHHDCVGLHVRLGGTWKETQFYRVKRLYFNTVYHYHVCMLDVPGTFFNATHQVKAIKIEISEANPLGESVDCSFPFHSTQRILPLNSGILFERATS